MRIAIGLVALLAACGSDTNMYPVGGGGTDGGFPDSGNTRPIDARLLDAKLVDSAAAPVDANVFQGRVCLLTDPRKLNLCAATGADGLTVRLGNASAVTAADGTFFITGQSGADLVWRITGPNIKSSYEVLRDYQIPAMTTTMFSSLLSGNGVMEVAGEGSFMVEVTHNGVGVSGAIADPVATAFYSPFYDGASATTWTQTSTGTEGAVWIPGIDVGSVSVKVAGLTTTGPVMDDGITFANVIVP